MGVFGWVNARAAGVYTGQYKGKCSPGDQLIYPAHREPIM